MTPSTAARFIIKGNPGHAALTQRNIDSHTHFSSGSTHTGPQRMEEEEVVVVVRP
ncbi:hypothetical protein GBF38_010707, partial [Nibea albiflora]